MTDKNWIQDVNKGMEERGTKGSFTKQAKRADMSVKDFAEDVKRNPDKFTKRTRQRANLAQTFENMNNKKSEKMATGGKTQGYNDELNESLGMRTGTGSSTTQSYKDRRDESKGANKNLGRRAYSSVETMDRGDRMFAKGGVVRLETLELNYNPKTTIITEDDDPDESYPIRDWVASGPRGGDWGKDRDKAEKEIRYLENEQDEFFDREGYENPNKNFAKGGTLSEKAVKKNYIRRDRYDKLKKEKDAKIDELKDENKDKVSDLKKDLKEKGADCYDDIKQTKKDIGKTVAKRIDQVEKKVAKEKDEQCDNLTERINDECEQDIYKGDDRREKEKTESLMLGGLGGLLLGFFLSR